MLHQDTVEYIKVKALYIVGRNLRDDNRAPKVPENRRQLPSQPHREPQLHSMLSYTNIGR